MPGILLKNARIYSPAGVFNRGTLAISGGKIQAFTRADSVTPEPRAPDFAKNPTPAPLPSPEVIDLGGGYVLPGFVDTHIHLTSIALKSLRCDLAGAASAGEVYDRLGEWAKTTDAPHVMGVEWDESRWDDPAYPTRTMLDRIDTRRPVLARRICGHVGVANTVLLKRLGEEPGETAAADLIDRDSGLVREHALWQAGRVCAPDPDKLADGFETAIRELHALGITAIHDIVGTDKFDAYLKGVAASRVPLRIDMLLVTEPREFPRFRDRVTECGIDNLRLAGIKCFLDGSLGGRTAALNSPYEKSHDTGVLLVKTHRLRAMLRECHDGGFMCAMHAIGDRAIDQGLQALADFPPGTDHFRMEHCEVVGPKQLEVLKESPVFLSLQPNFVRNWGGAGGLYEKRLGAARLERMNPFRTFLDAGVNFVFGSDGMPPGPLYGLRGATHHPALEERLTPAEAIDRYTRVPNTLAAHHRQAGVLEPGRAADLVVLDKNPLTPDVEGVEVVRTMVAGGFVMPGPEDE